MKNLVSVKDFEEAAKKVMTASAHSNINVGSSGERVLSMNNQQFQEYYIKPRVLRDVSTIDTTSTILNYMTSLPFGVSPMAMQKLVNPEKGELCISVPCDLKNIPYTLSLASTQSLETVSEFSPKNNLLFFVHYCLHDNKIELDLIRRAEAAGYKALVVTVDRPYEGKRELNWKTPFNLHEDAFLGNINVYERFGKTPLENLAKLKDMIRSDLTWKDIERLKYSTKLPIIIKGIQCAEDAQIARKLGVEAIWVSNHGGRSLDSQKPNLEVLEDCVETIDNYDKVQGFRKRPMEIYFDGGIRYGEDIFKALAIGADFVFVGRPLLWGTAVGGEEGARKILEILEYELKLIMALAGTTSIKEISKDYLESRKDQLLELLQVAMKKLNKKKLRPRL